MYSVKKINNVKGNGLVADCLIPFKTVILQHQLSQGSLTHPLMASVNHCCAPNAFVSVSDGDNALGIEYVTAMRDIIPGEEITITYTSANYADFNTRQNAIKKHCGFTCRCQVCEEKYTVVEDGRFNYGILYGFFRQGRGGILHPEKAVMTVNNSLELTALIAETYAGATIDAHSYNLMTLFIDTWILESHRNPTFARAVRTRLVSLIDAVIERNTVIHEHVATYIGYKNYFSQNPLPAQSS